MKRKPILMAAAVMLLWSSDSMAADKAGISHIPVLINVVILVGAVASLTAAFRLLGLVKGGALARGWQLWVISFVTLVLGQMVVLAQELKLFALNFDVAGIFYLATVVLWFLGLMQTRKVLG